MTPTHIEIRHSIDEGEEYAINEEAVIFFHYDSETKKVTDVLTSEVLSACNSYEELLEACKVTFKWFLDEDPIWQPVKLIKILGTAIANAEKGN